MRVVSAKPYNSIAMKFEKATKIFGIVKRSLICGFASLIGIAFDQAKLQSHRLLFNDPELVIIPTMRCKLLYSNSLHRLA